MVFGVLGLCVLGFGCLWLYVLLAADRSPSHVFINATKQELNFRSGETSLLMPASMASEVPPTIHTQEFDLQAKDSSVIWHYRWKPLDIRRYRIRYRIYLQVAEDGKIYVLPSQADREVKDLPPQPSGYPLEPESKR
jgi:hypothetical protein